MKVLHHLKATRSKSFPLWSLVVIPLWDCEACEHSVALWYFLESQFGSTCNNSYSASDELKNWLPVRSVCMRTMLVASSLVKVVLAYLLFPVMSDQIELEFLTATNAQKTEQAMSWERVMRFWFLRWAVLEIQYLADGVPVEVAHFHTCMGIVRDHTFQVLKPSALKNFCGEKTTLSWISAKLTKNRSKWLAQLALTMVHWRYFWIKTEFTITRSRNYTGHHN